MSDKSGSNKMLYLIVGALLVVVIGMGYVMMKDKADKPDLAIEISEDGIDIDSN